MATKTIETLKPTKKLLNVAKRFGLFHEVAFQTYAYGGAPLKKCHVNRSDVCGHMTNSLQVNVLIGLKRKWDMSNK